MSADFSFLPHTLLDIVSYVQETAYLHSTLTSFVLTCFVVIVVCWAERKHRRIYFSTFHTDYLFSSTLIIIAVTFKPFLWGIVLIDKYFHQLSILVDIIIIIITLGRLSNKTECVLRFCFYIFSRVNVCWCRLASILFKFDLNESHWRKCIELWYPERHSKAYFIPPQHFHREQVEEEYVGKARVTMKKTHSTDVNDPPVDDNAKDDTAQEDILIQLNILSKETKQAMMVISQLEFGNYLHKACYAAAAARYPNLKDLPIPEYCQGDFDMLIIHRKFGIIVGEIKSVSVKTKKKQEQEKVIRDRINKSLWQLEKAEKVLQHLLKDLPYIEKISKAIFLPNIDVEQFKRAISSDADLMEIVMYILQPVFLHSGSSSKQMC